MVILRVVIFEWEMSSFGLLKMFISNNERCHTTDAPERMCGTLFANVNNIQSMIPVDQNQTIRLQHSQQTICKHIIRNV